jgi:hypothetical protein
MGKLSFNNTAFVLDGAVTLNGRLNADPDTVGSNQNSWLINAANQTLTINPGSVFTVAANTWLILRNKSDGSNPVAGTGEGSAPQIVFANGSKVQHKNTAKFTPTHLLGAKKPFSF